MAKTRLEWTLALLRRDGWRQAGYGPEYTDVQARRCLVGAMLATTKSHTWSRACRRDARLLVTVIRAEYPLLILYPLNPGFEIDYVEAFNDDWATTWEDVERVLEKAIARRTEFA